MKSPRSFLVLALLWVVLFAAAFIAPRFMVTSGDGFTRGLNRLGAFFLWQFGAFLVAILLAILAWTRQRSSSVQKWILSVPVLIHILSVFLVIGVVVVSNFFKPKPQPYSPPPATAPAAEVAESLPASTASEPSPGLDEPPNTEVQTFMGIYRSGFETSHFYTMDGRGPWWLESEGEVHEQLQSYHNERPGRAGGITVAMTASGYLDDAGSEFDAIGSIDKRIHIVSIDSIRELSAEEFEMVLQATQNR